MSPPPSPLTPGPSRGRQTKLAEFQAPDTKSMERYNMTVAFFIVTCCLPLSLVEKAVFILLCAVLRPGCKPAGRKALIDNIPKLLSTTKQTLDGLMRDAAGIAYTSDAWTSKARESYVSLTVHFINTWQLISFTLCCRSFKDEYTCENIKDFFKEALADWQIPIAKVTSMTVDNGDNIRLAVDLLEVAGMRCFVHTIQTGCTLLETITAVKDLRTFAQTYAYTQLELDVDSQQLCTINTYRGLYRLTRLIYGVSSAASIFQSTMDKILSEINGVICYLDNIHIKGTDLAECISKTYLVLSRLDKHNVRLKLENSRTCANGRKAKYLG